MKQTEVKALRFHAGIAAAALAVLGSCGGGWIGQDEPPPPPELRLGITPGIWWR
ncbi:MAG: hypothetical protein LBD58_06700 [Treponema sp.]|jgi:hypothetical protein|nr:hypothetical protein [Treponema sp.]